MQIFTRDSRIDSLLGEHICTRVLDRIFSFTAFNISYLKIELQ